MLKAIVLAGRSNEVFLHVVNLEGKSTPLLHLRLSEPPIPDRTFYLLDCVVKALDELFQNCPVELVLPVADETVPLDV